MQIKKRTSIYIYLIYGVVFLMLATQVFLSIQVASRGSRMFILEKKGDEFSDKNKKLTSEIVSSSSLSQIEELSSGLGFIKPNKIVYLNGVGGTVAKIP